MAYQRHLVSRVLTGLKTSPVVLITGPRQSGKTTLTHAIGEELGYHFASFDHIAEQALALQDPIGFVEELPKPVVLDEVQRVPEIFLPIKVDVDAHRLPGRYLLTGSANPLLVPKLGDALTGRMFLYQLWPLSQGELMGVRENFINWIFGEDLGGIRTVPCSREDLLQRVELGGYPNVHLVDSERARREWLEFYLSLALQKDMMDLARIDGLAHLPNLLQILASRIGSLINYSDICTSSGIAVTTLKRYLQLLQSLYLIFSLPAWKKNLGQRLIKSPKIYFVDTGVLLRVLGLSLSQIKELPFLLGGAIENFVIAELSKQISWNEERIKLFYFRTQSHAEVDFVLEDSRSRVVGIEVKGSEIVRSEDFKHLKVFKEHAGDAFVRGAVLYAGNRVLPFGENLWAVPLSRLWEEI